MVDVNARFMRELGERIAERRKAAGITQTQLGKELGCSQQLIAAYEAGERRLPVSFLPVLSRLLDVTVNELLAHEDDARPKKRGPPPKLQRQLEQISRLPPAKQRFISEMLDTVLQGAETRR